MNVSFGKQNYVSEKPNYVKSATKGAVLTSGIYSVATAVSSLAQPDMFEQVVHEMGGKKEYAKAFAVGLGIIALGGALLSTVITAVASKVQPKENPKAN